MQTVISIHRKRRINISADTPSKELLFNFSDVQ